LPTKQLAGVLKRQSCRALPDPGKESFAPGAHDSRFRVRWKESAARS